MLRRRRGDAADDLTERHDLARPLLHQRIKAEPLQQARLIAAAARIIVPAHAGIVDARHHAAGEPEIDVVLILADRGRAIEQRPLMTVNPQRLRHHPFGRHRPCAIAVHLQRRIARRRDLRRHVAGAHIHPDQRRPQRLALGIQRHHAAAGGVGADGHHLVRPDLRVLHRLAHGHADGAPPVFGILLRPARLGKIRRIGCGGKGARPALQIEHGGAQRFRAAIDTHDIAFGHRPDPTPAGRLRNSSTPPLFGNMAGEGRTFPRPSFHANTQIL